MLFKMGENAHQELRNGDIHKGQDHLLVCDEVPAKLTRIPKGEEFDIEIIAGLQVRILSRFLTRRFANAA
jgi:hypothetical protein